MDNRPNILLIMTDQQRGDCLSIEGHPALLTPNMDHIAGSGVRFTRAYTTCPSCIAARRSLLSGQHPSTHGMVGYRDGVEWDAPPTLPGVLREAGYHTALVGRSMHQYPSRKRYGYDQMILQGSEANDYGEWLQRVAPEGSGGYYGTGVMHNDWTAHPWHLNEPFHATNWTVTQALAFLRRRDPSMPFFLTMSFLAPHPPLVPPAFYLERYLRMDLPPPVYGDWATPPANDGLGAGASSGNVHLQGEALRACRAGYFGLINHVDDQIRRLLNPVDGILTQTKRNTVVIFTADHGEMLGDHHCYGKRVPYEGATRIPFLIQVPERFEVKTGTSCDLPVCLEDVMPTALDLAGVEIPKTVEGRSLLPLLRGERPAWRERLHIEHAPAHHTLTNGREKYIWFVRDGREQFFDLARDPRELHDLAADPAAKPRVETWRKQLIEELRNRPEGFTDGARLIPGRPYSAIMAHAGREDEFRRKPSAPLW